MNGFGISSGPSMRPKGQSPFPSPPPPSSSIVAPPFVLPRQSSPRKGGIPEIMQSPPIAFQTSRSGADLPFSSDGILRRIDPRGNNEQKAFPEYNNPQKLQRPSVVAPFSTSNIFKPNLPGNIPPLQDLKRSRPPGNNFRNISQDVNGMRMDPRWNNEPKAFPDYNNPQMLQRPSAVASFSASTKFSPNVPAKIHQMQDMKRSRSAGSDSRVISQDVNGSRGRVQCDYSDLLTSQESSPVSPFVDPQESQNRYPSEPVDGEVLKQSRSPSLPFASEVQKENSFLARDTAKRPSMSPPIQVTRSNTLFHTPSSETHQRFQAYLHNDDSAASDTKPASFPATKRTRSPPISSSDQFFQGNSSQDETEREMQAKAKRLARFKVELSQTMPDSSDPVNQKFVGNIHDHHMAEKRKSAREQLKETVGDFPNGSALPEYEGLEASSVIIGLCPDMCPESERAERERKGDLDHYERLGGDRNQTSKSMAVKKYNRTAEREAGLIRPMPVLKNTIDYLLNLLDQSYDDKFLGMYNFLWDRMRAIRMDLRMQHIFNLGAIAMLEQMIRLHIIAMHELCEYTKGEGFSEGFDAHLNIEQMNKTSVELFQMYDDHRKKGVGVPTEKEFRGYYALLKLDKHPGYKVEPSELSLDLAKMTPEIRETPEVLFARDVARACRTGNFIAFFRLARRASYLQSCLMHAHFSKLRTQALASLHSGLQNNQGLPVSSVAKWLAMEEEDIRSLSDYHGFLLKEFEEPYMVKEGLFLNSEKDYATYCSKLVQQKRSRTICEDVSSFSGVVSLPAKRERKPQVPMVYKHDPPAVQIVKTPNPTFISDEDMPDSLTVPSPKDRMRVMPVFAASINQQSRDDHQIASVGVSPWNFFPDRASPQSEHVKVKTVEKKSLETLVEKPLDRSLYSDAKPMPLPISPGKSSQEVSLVSKFEFVAEAVSQNAIIEQDLQVENPMDIPQEPELDKAVELYHEKEAAEAKLKLILRIWRRRASKKKEQRMQRLLAANAAMNSLSIGPLIRHKRDDPRTSGEFNIDHVMWERYKKHGNSWSRLNVSDVVVDQLSQRNSEAKCICFKIAVCSHMGDTERKAFHTAASASLWLHSKLMPGKEDADNDLVKSLPDLSIWKKWLHRQYNADPTCCLSVIKDVKFDNLNETVLGASAVIFLVSERISWELQKTRLQSLVMSLPTNSRVPLLILTDSYNKDLTSNVLMDKMGLSESDGTRISGVRVLPLVKDLQVGSLDGFFSDEQLREGLQWLASESPLQPALHHVKTRELVMTRLNYKLESFNKMNVYEVGPNHCISALNEVMDQIISEVTEIANSSPWNWPCAEINLLDEFSAEHKAYKMYLPNVGWSSATNIEPLVCALMECKLPAFSYDISWLGQGSITGEEIVNQRSLLESYISRYMTESNKMDLTLASNEAHIMLQKNAVLELQNSTYYIIPRWVMIFRRIFNWQLMMLANGIISSAYISQWGSEVGSISGFMDLKLQTNISSYNLTHPSLDEMVELSCSSSLQSKKDSLAVQQSKDQSKIVSNHYEIPLLTNTTKSVVNDNIQQGGGSHTKEGLSASNVLKANESLLSAIAKKEGDKLSNLLQNCNMLQNMIHEKLSIYF